MKVAQIYELVNSTVSEILGKNDLLSEDLSNLVDTGKEVFDVTNVDNFVKKLIDKIGKTVISNRAYLGGAPNILMDNWEFGSVLEKIEGYMPDVEENESWKLEDGTAYDGNTFKAFKVSAKFYNSKTTFECDISITDIQVKEAFTSANKMNEFLSMIWTKVENKMKIAKDNLTLRVINNAMSEVLYDEYNGETGTTFQDKAASKSGVKAVNLLYLYNEKFGKSLTGEEAIYNAEFLRFSSVIIKNYISRLQKMSTLFNVGGLEKFTPKEYMHVILLDIYKNGLDAYLQSDTFHNEFTALPDSETVSYWQGTGTDYDFDSITTIDVKNSEGHSVKLTGILGVIFDRDACGITNQDIRIPSKYVPKAEFTNFFYKQDASYFNDLNENFVVFFVA